MESTPLTDSVRALRARSRVLVVEDDTEQAEILASMIELQGYDVAVAASAEQALALHRDTPADLVIADLNLPGMPGWELLVRLQSIEETPPKTIFVTGTASQDAGRKVLKLGALDCIRKPYDPDGLLARICELLAPYMPSIP